LVRRSPRDLLRRHRIETVVSVGAGALVLSVVAGTAAVAITRAVGNSSHPAASSTPATDRTPATKPLGVASTPATHTPPPLIVPRLRRLTPPDAVVRLQHQPTAKQLARLRHRPGVKATAALDKGTLRLPGEKVRVVGVPLSSIRGFTPALTAKSTDLWRSIARGELTVAFSQSRKVHRDFGQTVTATTGHNRSGSVRIGAFATLAIPHADAMMSSRAARTLGIARDREVLVAAPKISIDALKADVAKTLGKHAKVTITRITPFDQSVSSSYAAQVIPTSYLDLYRRAAVTCQGLPWTVLAAIGTVETGNGTNVHRSSAGAEGPMQFIPSTWAMYGYDADGDGKANIQDPVDAVFSAARYLCAAGAGLGGQALDNAIFAYNHAWWYVREVIIIANRYV
jgi:hypothetical protein